MTMSRERKRTELPVITPEDCKGCGSCCRHVPVPLGYRYIRDGTHLLPEDQLTEGQKRWLPNIRRLRRLPREAVRLLLERYAYLDTLPGGDAEMPCCWLDQDTMTCRWHRLRPDVCRAFEVGGEDCLRFRREYRVGHPPRGV
jgi:Fe-S-cluster containining protein